MTKTIPRDGLTTDQVLQRLFARNTSGFALLTEVGDATGTKQSRWADAVGMELYPSRGCLIHGYEIKVSRSDWLAELKRPEKAEAVCRFCDKWWVVAGHADIVKTDELPPTWGLLVPSGDGLTVRKQAPMLEPVPLTREFVAALFRRAAKECVDVEQLEQRYRDGFQAGYRQGAKHSSSISEHQAAEAQNLQKQLAAFEAASGVKIHEWQDGRLIGEAVRVVLAGGHKRYDAELRQIRRTCERIVGELQKLDPEPGKDAQ